jgi:hypothetical protein
MPIAADDAKPGSNNYADVVAIDDSVIDFIDWFEARRRYRIRLVRRRRQRERRRQEQADASGAD